MTRSKIGILLSLLIICFAVQPLSAVSNKNQNNKHKVSTTSALYSFPQESVVRTSSGTIPLGKTSYSRNSASVSPGTVIGDTWYDMQQNGTMGRMIDWGNSASTGTGFVHTIWMALPTAEIANRHYAYKIYNAGNGSLGTVVNPQNPTDFAGYCQVQSTGAGAAVLGGHRNPQNNGIYRSHFYYNFSPGSLFWGESAVDDSVASYSSTLLKQQVIWPKFAYHEGTDTVTHVIAQVFDENEAKAVYYFRKVGVKEAGVWDYPPYVVDTSNVVGHSVVASKISDKVAMAWLGRLPADGDCDTCSNNSQISLLWEQSDNDVYYQLSYDQGATWIPRVNVTKYQYGTPGFRAYSELSVLFDASDNFHVIWPARPWGATLEETVIRKACRLFHYSENVPVIRVVANNDWEIEDTIQCSSGKFELNISKVQISECDNKLYALFVQYNDFPNNVFDDCAARSSSQSEYQGSANGDLYMTVSDDGGMTWDIPRNLTNSRTPGCLPGDCESDSWPSMARYGRQNIAGEDWSGAVAVDPSGSYAGDMYLDVQYLSDRDAGGYAGGVEAEGTQQLSNMQWFRIACVEPTPSAPSSIFPWVIDYPTWVMPGEFLDVPLTITNNGNVAFTYSTSIVEDNGLNGWLSVSGLSGNVPSGLNNVEVGTIHLNDNGIITTPGEYTGRIVFTSNAPSGTYNLEVRLFVVDNITPTTYDTLAGYLSLSVASDGSYGHYKKGLGLDYYANGVDCDTFATTYVGEGSPVILKINGSDTLIGSSVFNNWLEDDAFKPIGDGPTIPSKGSGIGYNWYSTGTFVNPDSTIAFEQTFYAPTGVGENFMIKSLKIWSHDGQAHSGLRIGEVIDWDIPADSGNDNLSGIDPLVSRNLIYQVGTEFDNDGPFGNPDCVNDDTRFGGMAFLRSFKIDGVGDTTLESEIPYSAYTARNDSFVYNTSGLVAGETWENMDNSGFTVESDYTDQHMGMCYDPSLSILATDTIEYWIALATVYSGTAGDLADAIDASKVFANIFYPIDTSCCKGIRGNIDGDIDELIDISDLVFLVDFMFLKGPAPFCFEEGDVDGDGVIDISDLVCLVPFMFGGFPGCMPAPCP